MQNRSLRLVLHWCLYVLFHCDTQLRVFMLNAALFTWELNGVHNYILNYSCNPLFQRYHGAHVLLHALQFQTQTEEDKQALLRYKEAVEKRLHILEQQGFVQAYETTSY
jgi:hypothetical protein